MDTIAYLQPFSTFGVEVRSGSSTYVELYHRLFHMSTLFLIYVTYKNKHILKKYVILFLTYSKNIIFIRSDK